MPSLKYHVPWKKCRLFQELKMDSIWLSGQVGPSPHVKKGNDSVEQKVSPLQWVKGSTATRDNTQGTLLCRGGAIPGMRLFYPKRGFFFFAQRSLCSLRPVSSRLPPTIWGPYLHFTQRPFMAWLTRAN